jgi:hypothetical protein
MRAANPAPVEEVRAEISEEELGRRMDLAMGTGSSLAEPVSASSRRRLEGGGLRRVPRSGALVAGLCGAAVLALAFLLAGTPGGGGGHPSFATAAIEVAEANPRLLITLPGWEVIDAGEFDPDEGEVTFSDGARTFGIRWYPARYYESYLRDRAMVSAPKTSELLGRTATTVHYGRHEYATMLSPQGRVFVEVRGRLESRAEYDQVLRSLRAVDVEAWLEAMPPNVVRPEARAEAIGRMLRGVPLPPGFDRAGLEEEEAVLNHYQLAVTVAGAVSCGWVESWLSATESGDRAAAREAVDAMATAHGWPMMPTLIRGGGWSGNVWNAAAEIANGDLNRGAAGSVVHPDGSGYEVGPAWALSLNCTSRYWRRPLRR